MNVIEAQNILWKFYSKKECLTLKEDGKDDLAKELLLVSDDIDAERASIICALENFKEAGIVQNQKIGNKTFWVLKKPFLAIDQSVNVPPQLALGIADTINAFCESVEDNRDTCDVSSISTRDIQNLLHIITLISARVQEEKT